ncbi:MAG: Calx-beta domain-containing protein [Gemmataceae bacterium]
MKPPPSAARSAALGLEALEPRDLPATGFTRIATDYSLRGVSINEAGEVAYARYVSGTLFSNYKYKVEVGDGVNTRVVALDTFKNPNVSALALNESGRVAFLERHTVNGASVSWATTSALWPGGQFLADTSNQFASFQDVAQNDRGDVFYSATRKSGRTGVYSGQGQPVFEANSAVYGPSLNAGGQAAFYAQGAILTAGAGPTQVVAGRFAASLLQTSYLVAGNEIQVTLTLSHRELDWDRASALTVSYSTSPGTAHDGTDFEGASGSVTFPSFAENDSSSLSKTFKVKLKQVETPRAYRSFFVEVTTPTDDVPRVAAVNPKVEVLFEQGQFTSPFDPKAPAEVEGDLRKPVRFFVEDAFSPSAFTLGEAANETTPLKVVVVAFRQTATEEADASVSYHTEGVTAVQDKDFKGASNSLSFHFAKGQQQAKAELTLRTIDNDTADGPRLFRLVLDGPSGNASLSRHLFQVEIEDNEQVATREPSINDQGAIAYVVKHAFPNGGSRESLIVRAGGADRVVVRTATANEHIKLVRLNNAGAVAYGVFTGGGEASDPTAVYLAANGKPASRILAKGEKLEGREVSTIKDIDLNDKGQLALNVFFYPAFSGVYRTGATTLKPVLILPGIGGTGPSRPFLDGLAWTTHRSWAPEALVDDPFYLSYRDLIQTFVNAGYVGGVNLFVANYDWRMAPGPDDGVADGVLAGLTAASITDGRFKYGVDYLGYWLKKASDVWLRDHGEALDEVDIVAHSTGGLVTRAYLQSGAYTGTFTDSAGAARRLPAVRNFVMYDVPNQGASKVWNFLHDDWNIPGSDQRIYNTAFPILLRNLFYNVMGGTVITGHDYNIGLYKVFEGSGLSPAAAWNLGQTYRAVYNLVRLKQAALSPSYPKWFAFLNSPRMVAARRHFIDLYVPTMRSLLSTYPGFLVGGTPDITNTVLIDLNVPDAQGQRFVGQVRGKVINVYGDGLTTPVTAQQFSHSPPDLGPTDWIYPFDGVGAYKPRAGEVWYRSQPGNGDGTVPLVSLAGQFVGDPRVVNARFATGENTAGGVNHTEILANVDAQLFILTQLGRPVALNLISTGHQSFFLWPSWL